VLEADTSLATCFALCFSRVNYYLVFPFYMREVPRLPIPVAVRSKASVCGRWLAGIAVSNPAGAWMSVCCECCVLSGRGLCVGLITRPEESYRVWCVIVKTRLGGGPGPLGVVASLKKVSRIYFNLSAV